jgi:hypothetical protein
MSKSRRLELHQILVDLLGSTNSYFQPPDDIKLKYPCIMYRRSRFDSKYADDLLYKGTQAYQVTVMDFDPDSDIPDKIRNLPLCRFDRHFTKDGLNHDVFNLYY